MKTIVPTKPLAASPADSARECLNHINRMLRPNWGLVHQFRQDRGRRGIPNWPEPCFLPQLLWAATLPAHLPYPPFESRILVRSLAAVGAWRFTQGVYQVDPTAYEAICGTPPKGPLGDENFEGAPDYCSYVVTQSLMIGATPVRGAFMYQDFDFTQNCRGLCMVLDLGDQYFAFDIALGSGTLEESLNVALARQVETGAPDAVSALMASGPNTAKDLRRAVEAVVSLYLYLCAENADIGEGSERPAKPQPKRTKRGYRLFPPNNPKVWAVASRVGAKLRASREWAAQRAANDEQGTHAGPRPHFRRAHWHTYLVGPGKGRSVHRWVHPCLVNCDNPEMLAATVRSVASANDPQPKAA